MYFYIFLFLGTVRNRIVISVTIKLTIIVLKGIFTAATTQVSDKYKGWKKWNVSNDVWKLFRSQNKQKKQLENRSRMIWTECKNKNIFLKRKNRHPGRYQIIRINNMELVVDWWSRAGVTWRQASSQSHAWGTFAKLQSGACSVCNTEQPAHRGVEVTHTL